MADYVAPLGTRTNPRKPITSEWAKAADDRPIAVAEGAPGSPYVRSAWHPYNGLNVGDGFNGRVWSFAVDGATAAFETPNFVDGYEYMLSVFDISHNNVSSLTVDYQLRRETGGGLITAIPIATLANAGATASFNIHLTQPRRVSTAHIVNNATVPLGSSSAVRNIRVSIAGGANFDAGGAFLYRRLAFI